VGGAWIRALGCGTWRLRNDASFGRVGYEQRITGYRLVGQWDSRLRASLLPSQRKAAPVPPKRNINIVRNSTSANINHGPNLMRSNNEIAAAIDDKAAESNNNAPTPNKE
jgi:hypothetical protein